MDLTRNITEKIDLRALGVKLGVPLTEIDAAITNNNSHITEATYIVLRDWRTGQGDDKVAWRNLKITLQSAGLNNLINLLHKKTTFVLIDLHTKYFS